MSFDEYLELRLLAFSMWVTNKGIVYDSVIKFLREKNIDVFDLFYNMVQNKGELSPKIQNVFEFVKNATKDELWETRSNPEARSNNSFG